jgi:hypothetical protein
MPDLSTAIERRRLLRQFDAESLRHSIQRPPIDAEHFRRSRSVAADRLEHVQEIPSLELIEPRQICERRVGR